MGFLYGGWGRRGGEGEGRGGGDDGEMICLSRIMRGCGYSG